MDHHKPHLNSFPGGADGVPPVTEADLHAFADGLLPAERRAAIEAFLDAQPAARERVDDWKAQNAALKQLLDPVLDEPLPLRLPLAPAPPMWPAWNVRGWAAGIAIAVASAGSAWWMRGAVDSQALAAAAARQALAAAGDTTLHGFAQRAAVAHVVYSPDARRPVEVGADQQQALVNWLTKRIGTAVRPPDLHTLGYELIGGRLLPGGKGPVAQFMFGDAQGQKLTLYITREDAGRETAFRFGQEGAVNVFYWVDKDFGYALSAGASRDQLARVAQAVYQQLEAR
ncbi:MAG: anti-sigma factor [Pseudomonadota bacterium]